MALWAPRAHVFVCPGEQNIEALKQNIIHVLGLHGSGLLELSAMSWPGQGSHLRQGFAPLAPSHSSPFPRPLLWYLQGLQNPPLPSCPSEVPTGRRYRLGALSRGERTAHRPSSDPTGLGQKTEPMPECSPMQEIPVVLQLVGSWGCLEPELGWSFVCGATSLATCAADTGKS